MGVLLTNIGSPDQPTSTAVRRYLKLFLSDERVVSIPRYLWWPILYGVILPTRSAYSANLYKKIWTPEGSPLLFHTQSIANKLQAQLQLPVELGMHYGNPSISDALEKLRALDVKKIFILPLYPQYSATTTAVTFDQVAQTFKRWQNLPELQIIHDYADEEKYINALAISIENHFNQCKVQPYLLFSFHGIPQDHANKGDPYPERCYLTAELVADKLHLTNGSWSVAFQSRLGRAKWLTPYTDQVLQSLPKQGIKQVSVICPGFSVDCLETLEEIAMRGKNQFLSAGGEVFNYIPALNDGQEHIKMLSAIITRKNNTITT